MLQSGTDSWTHPITQRHIRVVSTHKPAMHTYTAPRTPENTSATRPIQIGLGFTLNDGASPFPQHLSDSPLMMAATMSLTGSITPSHSRWSSSPGSPFSARSSPSSSACPSPSLASKPHQRTVSAPLLPVLASGAMLAPSPPLIPLHDDVKQATARLWQSACDADYTLDGLHEQELQSKAADAGVSRSQTRTRTALLPSAAILPSLLPPYQPTPPGSPLLRPRARLCPSPATPLNQHGQEHSKRKRCATSPRTSSGSASPAGGSARTGSSGKRFKSSPAIQHLGIFTHAAFAQAHELAQAHSDVASELEGLDMDLDMDRDMANDGNSARRSPSLSASSRICNMRGIDLDILVADSPVMMQSAFGAGDDDDAAAATSFGNSVGGGLPATPRSTVLPGLTFSTSFSSASSWASSASASSNSSMSSLWDRSAASATPHMAEQNGPTFEEQIKADVQRRLRLSDVGLGIEHISLFPTGADWGTVPSSGRMTVVVHTA